MIESLQKLFARDLSKLEEEINHYKNPALIWMVKGEISNSTGNLTLHLCGNLQNYIGMILGGSGYKRNRPYEFAARDLSQEKLLSEINTTKEAVHATLQNLTNEDLEKMYPTEELGYPMTTGYFLLHLACHLNYHLGQINYHRRLITPGT